MQEDLINQVASRAGISQEQAQQAVNTVLEYAQQNLPAPLGEQLANALQGGGGQGGLGQIGGMFGG